MRVKPKVDSAEAARPELAQDLVAIPEEGSLRECDGCGLHIDSRRHEPANRGDITKNSTKSRGPKIDRVENNVDRPVPPAVFQPAVEPPILYGREILSNGMN